MAINVNTVYTTVLSILNKEQRGYITPDEFNKIGTQVQLEIFEKFFEDYNQYTRMPKTDVEFASRMEHIYEEFQIFMDSGFASAVGAATPELGFNVSTYTQPTNVHRIGSMLYAASNGRPEIELVNKREFTQQTLSPLTSPTLNFPIGVYQQDKVVVYPGSTAAPSVNDVLFNFIRKPLDVRWGYSIGSLGQYIYDPTIYALNLLNNGGSLLSSINPNLGVLAPTLALTTVEPGVTAGVSIVKANAAATGLKLNIAVTLGSGIITLTVNTPGTDYSVNDTITFAGATFDPNGGGAGVPGADAICTLAAGDFNSGSTYGSTNFEISDSQQTEVVLEILKYSGIVIRDPQIIQAASRELAQEEANSKR